MKKLISIIIVCTILLAVPIYADSDGIDMFDAIGKYAYSDGAYYLDYYNVIDYRYSSESTELFNEGLLPVCVDGKWGFIDTAGKLAIPLKYDRADHFSMGLACVEQNGKLFYIDAAGIASISLEYDDAGSFADGLASVKKDDKYGFIDITGKLVIECIYEEVGEPSENLIAVKKDGKYGFIDYKGNNVIPFEYDYADKFSTGVAYVTKDYSGKLIGTDGSIIYENVFSNIYDGIAMIEENGKWGFVDNEGNIVIECVWDDVEFPSEGLVGVCKDGKWGFADYSGTLVIDTTWDYIWPFSNGMAKVANARANGYGIDKYGFINKLGENTIPVTLIDAQDFSDDLAPVCGNNLWGYLGINGKQVIACEYDFVSSFINGVAVVGKDGKFMLINKNGEVISIYDNEASNGTGSVIGDIRPNTEDVEEADNTETTVTEEKKDTKNIAAIIVVCVTLLMVLLIIVSLSVRTYNIHMRKRRRRMAIENLKKRNNQSISK